MSVVESSNPFTGRGFTEGLRRQRNNAREAEQKRLRYAEAAREKRMAILRERVAWKERFGQSQGMFTIKMFIGEWFKDTDGCWTRHIHQLDEPFTHTREPVKPCIGGGEL